jgi:hypothetical protein
MDFQLGHQGWGLAVSLVWFVTYWALIIHRAVTDNVSFTNVAWQHPLLWMLAMGAVVYGAIYASFYWSTRGAIRTDERDEEIRRRSDAAGTGFIALGAVAALVMLALGVGAFWVAHTILIASFLGTLASTGQTVAAYMDGFDR